MLLICSALKSRDSDETDDSSDTVESSDPGKYEKSCYPSEYGKSAGSGNSVDFCEGTDDSVDSGVADDLGEFSDSE